MLFRHCCYGCFESKLGSFNLIAELSFRSAVRLSSVISTELKQSRAIRCLDECTYSVPPTIAEIDSHSHKHTLISHHAFNHRSDAITTNTHSVLMRNSHTYAAAMLKLNACMTRSVLIVRSKNGEMSNENRTQKMHKQ